MIRRSDERSGPWRGIDLRIPSLLTADILHNTLTSAPIHFLNVVRFHAPLHPAWLYHSMTRRKIIASFTQLLTGLLENEVTARCHHVTQRIVTAKSELRHITLSTDPIQARMSLGARGHDARFGAVEKFLSLHASVIRPNV